MEGMKQEPEESLVQHPENMRLRDMPKDLLENITRLREEARKFNEEAETQRKGFEGFLVRVEAFNIKIENFFKDLLK